MASAPTDGPSRPFGVEFGLGAGITIVLTVIIGVVTIGAVGMAGLLYFAFSFLVGLVVWIPLLLVARRITRERPAPARVLASAIAALLAIGINFLVVVALIVPLGGYYGLYLVFAIIESIIFLVAALAAAFVSHLTAARRRAP